MSKVLGFADDIKPLFGEWHRAEMDWMFDLWSYQDVKARATRILERLEDETMPCDQPWDAVRIATFRTWVEEGCRP